MITDNFVMWETKLSIVDWVYSKTQILRETLKTQYHLRVESNVSLKVEHLFRLDACLRMEKLLALDVWDVVMEVLHSNIRNHQPNKQQGICLLNSNTSGPKR